MKPRPRREYGSRTVIFGSGVALIGFVVSAVTLSMDLARPHVDPYRGIFTFLVFPSVMFAGMAIAAVGLLLRSRWRRRRKKEEKEAGLLPVPGLEGRPYRRWLLGFVGFLLFFLVVSLIGAIQAFHFTESVEFCGETCHEPMEPQFTAYRQSPHARISCTECHVGSGIGGYVEAKVSGLRQVYTLLADSVERPITAPRHKILPVNETCEDCHWSETLWGVRMDRRVRFGYDARNTQRPVHLLLNVGRAAERGSGIHWHADARNAVRFRALDDALQEIVWVEALDENGAPVVYRREGEELSEQDLETLQVHSMDCLDCHNRPAHQFLTPDRAVDRALERGRISRFLPFVKKVAVEALSQSHLTRASGLNAIRERMQSYYRREFNGVVAEERQRELQQAIDTVQDIYRRNFFPEMKVNGFTHPDNIGHREFRGCFRCHGGKHKTADGQVLNSSCDLCHAFVRAGDSDGTLRGLPASSAAFHPWKDYSAHPRECWECHTGKSSPYETCGSCHKDLQDRHVMNFECSICHKPGNPKMTSERCASCHPTAKSAMHAHVQHRDCLVCHKPHHWKTGNEDEQCGQCHKKMMATHYPGESCAPCHPFAGVEAKMMGLPVSRDG